MQISGVRVRPISFFFSSKHAYPIVRQLHKRMCKNLYAFSRYARKTKSWVQMDPPPLMHLSVKMATFMGSETDTWPQSCSLFYWANWLTWAPITALFLGKLLISYFKKTFLNLKNAVAFLNFFILGIRA